MTNYLFICGQNKIRSKCIAQYFSELLQEKGIEGCVESAGLYVKSEEQDSWGCSSRKVSKELCDVVDVVFVMEEWMVCYPETTTQLETTTQTSVHPIPL